MILSRRTFLRSLGLALAGLALARCGPRPAGDTPRDRVREAWLSLGELGQETLEDTPRGEARMGELSAAHRAALDELVAGGELTPAVAGDVQAAFGAAAYHAWRANANMTCYEPVVVDYGPAGAADLGQQAAALAEMARQSDLDPQAVARAQAALERDIAFVALPDADEQALYNRLIEAWQAGSSIPPFGALELSIPPDAAAAARFLVEVLGSQ